jgi:hypothetical protein
MEENGFTVKVENVDNLAAVKDQYQVPPDLQSCHTAIVDGYVIEGHVPAADIKRLLKEKPAVIGLAVPGMPVGAPGMIVAGAAPQPYDVIAFDKAGKQDVYASYNSQ